MSHRRLAANRARGGIALDEFWADFLASPLGRGDGSPSLAVGKAERSHNGRPRPTPRRGETALEPLGGTNIAPGRRGAGKRRGSALGWAKRGPETSRPPAWGERPRWGLGGRFSHKPPTRAGAISTDRRSLCEAKSLEWCWGLFLCRFRGARKGTSQPTIKLPATEQENQEQHHLTGPRPTRRGPGPSRKRLSVFDGCVVRSGKREGGRVA